MTTKQVAEALGVDVEYIRKSKGQFRYHKSYYYGFTQSGESLALKVKEKLTNATIIEYGNHWHEFVGEAKSGSAKDSYLWVTFTA